MTASLLLVLLALDWPQWGGPARDFHATAGGAAIAWPAEGPRRLWSRALGEGYAGIVTSGDALYTLYRRGGQEVVIALDAATGRTRWEFVYDAPLPSDFDSSHGTGPRATPLVIGDRLFTAGVTARLHCFDRASGRVVWSRDLVKEDHAQVRVNGYSASPLAWRDNLILIAGAPGGAVMSLRQSDGGVIWKRLDALIAYSSPVLTNVAGKEQVVALLAEQAVGLNPADGERLWSHPHMNSERVNATQPVTADGGLLLLTSAYDGGCRTLRLSANGAEELWTHRLMRVHFTNAVRVDDVVYASSGDFGPTPLAAVNIRTGQILWRDRTIAKASLVAVGGRLLILDEDGALALATPGAKGLEVHGKTSLLSSPAWTPPTVTGRRVYLRDQKVIMAVELAGGGE